MDQPKGLPHARGGAAFGAAVAATLFVVAAVHAFTMPPDTGIGERVAWGIVMIIGLVGGVVAGMLWVIDARVRRQARSREILDRGEDQ